MRLLALLALLQAGCLLESDSVQVAGECGPRDMSPECCLKKNPGQWDRCTGSSELARAPSLDLLVDYRGLSAVPLPWPERKDDVSVLYFRLPTGFLEKRRQEHVRALALELAAELPFSSGYVDFVLCSDILDSISVEALKLIRPRYPGVHLASYSATTHVGTRVDGVHWVNFLGQPVLGELGGVSGLRERLALPGISLQEMSGDRVLITLGERPEVGDVEAGQTLPLHRALAKVLEPYLYQRKAFFGNPVPEELLRWDRRFLD